VGRSLEKSNAEIDAGADELATKAAINESCRQTIPSTAPA
jgi:hypothetical protein